MGRLSIISGVKAMTQLELFEDIKQDRTYTVGVLNDHETLWFVRNDHKEKNKTIMEYLLMYPHTRPLQSNYKFYQYQLIENQKKKNK